jgi:hypothetical protein
LFQQQTGVDGQPSGNNQNNSSEMEQKLTTSHTLDSLNELQVNKTGTPSMVSRFEF